MLISSFPSQGLESLRLRFLFVYIPDRRTATLVLQFQKLPREAHFTPAWPPLAL